MRLYHGAAKKYNTLKPIGLDFGNKYNPPGWSIFLFKKYSYAESWAVNQYMKNIYWRIHVGLEKKGITIHKSIFNNKYCKPMLDKESFEYYIQAINKYKSPQYAYVYECEIPMNKIHLGNDSYLDEYTVREEIKPIKVHTIEITEEYLRNLYIVYETTDERNYEYFRDNYSRQIMFHRGFFKSMIQTKEFYVNQKLAEKLYDEIRNGELTPGDDLEEYLENRGYQIYELKGLDRIVHWIKNTYCDNIAKQSFGELALITESITSSKLYHGSVEKLDILEPIAIDLGNKFDPPGWSVFLFKDKNHATAWAIRKAIIKNLYVDTIREDKKTYTPQFYIVYDYTITTPYTYDKLIAKFKTIKYPIYAYVYECNIPRSKQHIGCNGFLDEVTVREPVYPDKVYSIRLTEDLIEQYCHTMEEDELKELWEESKKIRNQLVNRNLITTLFLDKDNLINREVKSKLDIDIREGKLQPGDSLVEYMELNGYELHQMGGLTRLMHYVKNSTGSEIRKSFEEETIQETVLLSKDNLELNLDQWAPGNPLFITGSSGDGKSTLARKYAEQYNAEVCSLDVPLIRIYRSKEKFDKLINTQHYNFLISKSTMEMNWIKAHPNLPYDQDINTPGLLESTTLEYVEWCTEHCPKDKLLIFEGCDLISLGPDYFIDKPLIVTGNSRISNLIRRAKRSVQKKPYKNFLTEIFSELKQYITTYGKAGSMSSLDKSKEEFRKEMDRLIANQEATMSDWETLDLMESIYEAYEDDPQAHDEFDYETAVRNGGFWSYRSVTGEPCHTWNSLKVINGKNYRNRIETLIIRGDKVLLNKTKKGEIKLPGGSTEFDKPEVEQAMTECEEEVHIIVKNIRPTGETYMEDKTSAWTKILPLQYDGRFTTVYIAEYDKPYRGKVAKVDQDPGMLKGSKWYKIEDVYDELRPEWQRALIKFGYISETYMKYRDTYKAITEVSEDVVSQDDIENNLIEYPIPELMPYFTPQELKNIGVFNENPEDNYYNTKSTLESKEWFKIYSATGYPGDNYGIELSKLYEEVLSDPSDYNKQRLLEFGWNPEVPLSNETTLHQNIVKESIYSRYGVTIVTI